MKKTRQWGFRDLPVGSSTLISKTVQGYTSRKQFTMDLKSRVAHANYTTGKKFELSAVDEEHMLVRRLA